MEEYIKVVDDNPQYTEPMIHNNWFRLVYPQTAPKYEFNQRMKQRATARIITGALHGDIKTLGESPIARIVESGVLADESFDYNHIANKHNHVIMVRPSGTMMSYPAQYTTDEELAEETNLRIVDRVYCSGFPLSTTEATVAVIENSYEAEPFWLKYLGERFNGCAIRVVNYFGTLTDAEIKRNLDGIKYITFSTTFTDLDWFKRVISFRKPNQQVIGYSHNPNKWEAAKAICKDVEIINQVTQ